MAGASIDIVILSSSPPPHYAPSSPLNGGPRSSPRRVAMSASPLPALSPPASPLKKIAGASAASRKAAIPPDAIRGFATVGSLVRSEHFAQHEDITEKEDTQSRRGSTEDAGDVTPTGKKPRKRTATAPAQEGDAKPDPKPRLRKPKVDRDTTAPDPELRLPVPKKSPYFTPEVEDPPIPTEPVDVAANLTKAGKPRKPRAKKEKAERGAEPKSKKPRVAKPKAAAKEAGELQREDAGVTSAHFRELANESTPLGLSVRAAEGSNNIATEDASIWDVPPDPQPKKKRAPKQKPPAPVVESLDLEEAVSRRRDWTPPRDTAIASPFTDSVGKENKQLEPAADSGSFTHMISNFAYAQAPSLQSTVLPAASATGTMAVTKRRRVEVSSQ
jgi:hypothetical protein